MTIPSIAIVGNADIDPVHGPAIDACDIVIRFNDCRSFGPGGLKTDIVAVCNTGRPGERMTQGPDWRINPAVKAASDIWCVRDGAFFAAMRQGLMATHPELDDFCDDHTSGFLDIALDTGKTVHIIPPATHEETVTRLIAFDPEPYVVPSSGLIVIIEAMRLYPVSPIRIAGFGHQGWEWHPFAAERRLVDHLVATGRLARLDPQIAARQAEGA